MPAHRLAGALRWDPEPNGKMVRFAFQEFSVIRSWEIASSLDHNISQPVAENTSRVGMPRLRPPASQVVSGPFAESLAGRANHDSSPVDAHKTRGHA